MLGDNDANMPKLMLSCGVRSSVPAVSVVAMADCCSRIRRAASSMLMCGVWSAGRCVVGVSPVPAVVAGVASTMVSDGCAVSALSVVGVVVLWLCAVLRVACFDFLFVGVDGGSAADCTAVDVCPGTAATTAVAPVSELAANSGACLVADGGNAAGSNSSKAIAAAADNPTV